MKLIFLTVRKSKTCKSTIKYRWKANTRSRRTAQGPRTQTTDHTMQSTMNWCFFSIVSFCRFFFSCYAAASRIAYVTKRPREVQVKDQQIVPYHHGSESQNHKSRRLLPFCVLCKLNGCERCTQHTWMSSSQCVWVLCAQCTCSPHPVPQKKGAKTSPPPSIKRAQHAHTHTKRKKPIHSLLLCAEETICHLG